MKVSTAVLGIPQSPQRRYARALRDSFGPSHHVTMAVRITRTMKRAKEMRRERDMGGVYHAETLGMRIARREADIGSASKLM